MPLESGIAAYVAALKEEMVGAPAPVTADDRRRWFSIRGERFKLPLPEGIDIIDDFVCAPGREIPVRRYRPKDALTPPVVAYFHGGGWVAGSIATHEMLTAVMAAETGAEVVSVHYRRPPENPYPAALGEAATGSRAAGDRQSPHQEPYPSIREKSATERVASRISANRLSRFSRSFGSSALTVTASKNMSTGFRSFAIADMAAAKSSARTASRAAAVAARIAVWSATSPGSFKSFASAGLS